MTFGRLWFDADKTERLIECVKRYRRVINQSTNEAGAPLHDEFSHGADNLRYICINAEAMSNEEWGGKLTYLSDEVTNADDSQRKIWITEAYVRCDFDGDGISELRKVTVIQ